VKRFSSELLKAFWFHSLISLELDLGFGEPESFIVILLIELDGSLVEKKPRRSAA
jgi:hypothetical protein